MDNYYIYVVVIIIIPEDLLGVSTVTDLTAVIGTRQFL